MPQADASSRQRLAAARSHRDRALDGRRHRHLDAELAGTARAHARERERDESLGKDDHGDRGWRQLRHGGQPLRVGSGRPRRRRSGQHHRQGVGVRPRTVVDEPYAHVRTGDRLAGLHATHDDLDVGSASPHQAHVLAAPRHGLRWVFSLTIRRHERDVRVAHVILTQQPEAALPVAGRHAHLLAVAHGDVDVRRRLPRRVDDLAGDGRRDALLGERQLQVVSPRAAIEREQRRRDKLARIGAQQPAPRGQHRAQRERAVGAGDRGRHARRRSPRFTHRDRVHGQMRRRLAAHVEHAPGDQAAEHQLHVAEVARLAGREFATREHRLEVPRRRRHELHGDARDRLTTQAERAVVVALGLRAYPAHTLHEG